MLINNEQNIIRLLELWWRWLELADIEERSQEEQEEYLQLSLVAQQLDAVVPDWQGNSEPSMVRDSYFAYWARTEARMKSNVMPPDDPWPLNHIDWDAASAELRLGYAELTFDGVTYLVNSGSQIVPMSRQ